MKTITSHFVYFIIVMIHRTQSLVELPKTENSIIATTEAKIRNITNELFVCLKLNATDNPQLKPYSLVHNFFTSITLQDEDNLNQLERMTNVYENDNITRYFIAVINEILNDDDDNNKDTAEDISISQYIVRFILQIKDKIDKHGLNVHDLSSGINPEIVKHLTPKDDLTSVNNTTEDSIVLSDNEFWKKSDVNYRRIFNGHKTRIQKFPFVASVQFFQKFMCGGSIIKSDLVITAASCLQLAWNNRFYRENPSFLSVQIGSSFYEHGGENIAVIQIYFYPNYNPKTLEHNLAIMRLTRRIKFGKRPKRVKKIDIDRNPSALPFNIPGITIVGWGARSASNKLGNIVTNRLSYTVLDVYPLYDCQEVYTKDYVKKQNFCAGFISRGGGACNHDVGGPGIYENLLMGVISFGSVACGEPDSPTVFTKLGYYTDWIEEIMEQDVPHAYTKTTLKFPPSRPTASRTFATETSISDTPATHTDEKSATRYTDPPKAPITTDTPYPRTTSPPSDFSLTPIVTGDSHEYVTVAFEPIKRSQELLHDDSIFTDFMATMFHSKEKELYAREHSSHKKLNLSNIDKKELHSILEIMNEEIHGLKDKVDSGEESNPELESYKPDKESSELDTENPLRQTNLDLVSHDLGKEKKSDDVAKDTDSDDVAKYKDLHDIAKDKDYYDIAEGKDDDSEQEVTSPDLESESSETRRTFSIPTAADNVITKPVMAEGDEDMQIEKGRVDKSAKKLPSNYYLRTKDDIAIAKNHKQHLAKTTTAMPKTVKYTTHSKITKKVKIKHSPTTKVTQKVSTLKKKHKTKSIGRDNLDIDVNEDALDKALVITDDKVEIDIEKLIQSLDINEKWHDSIENNTSAKNNTKALRKMIAKRILRLL